MYVSQEVLKQILEYDPIYGNFRWRPGVHKKFFAGSVAGHIDTQGYRRIVIRGRPYSAARLAWLYSFGSWPSKEIDHINNDRADNRLVNLREATRSQNVANALHSESRKSPFKGVVRVPSGKMGVKWRAQIVVDGKNSYLGWFDTPEAAHAAYVTAATKVFGEYANDGRRSFT